VRGAGSTASATGPAGRAGGGFGAAADTGSAAPVSAAASARVGKDPSKTGTFDDHDISLTTPVGTYVLQGAGVRGGGSGVACRVGVRC
ncbi:MAG: hypothetical protein QOF18_1505, partial [Frankiaceae bacterium]|nr:hypothetical protein [Frankiaceae bacterium]